MDNVKGRFRSDAGNEGKTDFSIRIYGFISNFDAANDVLDGSRRIIGYVNSDVGVIKC